MDDGEEEPYQSAEPEDVPFDEFAIPDEADQMGIPDAVRFEQAQREKRQTEEDYESSDISDKTHENKLENTGLEPSDTEKSVQPHNYVIDIHNQETGGEKTRYQWNVDAIKTLKQVEAEGGREADHAGGDRHKVPAGIATTAGSNKNRTPADWQGTEGSQERAAV